MIVRFKILIACLLFYSYSSNAQYKNGWFKAKQIADKTWLIDEHNNNNIYLLEGKDSALIIDAGFGLANLKGFIQTLTSKPLIIVNTHAHPDHAGGDYQFSKVYIGANDIELAKYYTEPSTLKYIIDSLFKVSIPDSLRSRDTSSIRKTAFLPVQDGYVFRLGGRDVQVIEVQGHTPGSICLLDPDTKFLFSGDNGQAMTWLFLKESMPVEVYLQTQKKLVSLKSNFSKLFPGHGPSLPVEETLNDLIACSNLILSGKGELKPYKSFAGEAKSCTYGSVTIAFDPNKLK